MMKNSLSIAVTADFLPEKVSLSGYFLFITKWIVFITADFNSALKFILFDLKCSKF